MESTYAELTGFQRDILHTLSRLKEEGKEEDPKGLDIKHELQEYYDKNVNNGRLYPNLDKLANQDLINKGKKSQRTNKYSLTTKGQTALAERQAWEENRQQKCQSTQIEA